MYDWALPSNLRESQEEKRLHYTDLLFGKYRGTDGEKENAMTEIFRDP
jgi:hypothetical protein